MRVRITGLDDYDESVEIGDEHSIPHLLKLNSIKCIAVELQDGSTLFYSRAEEQ